MRVAFIEPDIQSSSQTVYAGNNALEPLGLEYLAGEAVQLGWETKVFVERLLHDRLIEAVVTFNPDVVGITSLTCNSLHAIDLAKTIKDVLGCMIVMGGYHASALPDEIASCEFIDYVVVGEGERVMAGILQAVEAGACRRHDEKITSSTRICNLAFLPRPVRSEEILSGCRLLGLMVPAPTVQKRVAAVSTSRGCINSCEFCSSGVVWGRQVFTRPANDFVSEIRELIDRFQVSAYFISDLSFNGISKHVEIICRALIAVGISTPWYAMCCMSNLSDGILALMAAAGCRKIGIGIENPLYLERKKIKSGKILTDDEIFRVIDAAHRHGVLVKGYFMVGYPWETESSLLSFQKAIIRFPFDEIKISFYTPFPGTAAYEKYKDRLIAGDWRMFDSVSQPLLLPKGMSAAYIIGWRRETFLRFYTSESYKNRVNESCRRNYSLVQSYIDFENQLSEALSVKKLFCVDISAQHGVQHSLESRFAAVASGEVL